mmetsp:Transcript_58133/g.127424  ORF Transcript_58133/g.127424 Transcript_58133/m.127424 type:complete len:231 (-) Transcript_58133:552-1244(-)
MLISPRNLILSCVCLLMPPISSSSNPFFTSKCPCTIGATAAATRSKTLGSRPNSSRKSFSLRSNLKSLPSISTSGRIFTKISCLSSLFCSFFWTKQPRKACLWLKLRIPNSFNPVIPSLSPSRRPLLISFRTTDVFNSPGFIRLATSGTTIMHPVTITLSPGLHFSQISSRTITSMDRGMDPAGMADASSWTRSFCQSQHSPSSRRCNHFVVFRHNGFGQFTGSVSLNCC